MQPHDGQPVEAERRRADMEHARVVRAAGNGLVKAGAQRLRGDGRAEITDDGTHRIFLLNKKYAATVRAIGRVVAYRGATYFTSQGFKQTAPG